jgi:multidrug resistance efflux pump
MARAISLISAVIVALFQAGCGSAGFGFNKDAGLVFYGTVETQDIRVGSKVGGRIQEVLVKEGAEVRAGQPLVCFDMAELQAQLAQAQARVDQQRSILEKIERGARPEEKAEARAATEAAKANLESVRNWPRSEEVAQARAALSALEAEVKNAEADFQRAQRLRETGDISKQDYDAAKYRYDNIQSQRNAQKQQLELLLNGSRKEDIRAAEEKHKQAQEAERLILAGARAEDISTARAQLSEAQARVEQLKVQLAEGQVTAPADAVVEVLPVRPGDLLTPNQTVAQLLEKDQIWVRIYIPEPQLGLVKIGQRAKVKIDTFKDREFDGVVEQINSQGEFTPRNVQSREERNHQVFGVKVRIDNRDGILKSGMAAEVTLGK